MSLSHSTYLLQPPDLLLLLLQDKQCFLVLHFQLLPPLSQISHVLQEKAHTAEW